MQLAVPQSSLVPYIRKVASRRSKNPESAAWPILDKAWLALTDKAQGVLALRESGQPCVSWQVRAAEQLVAIAREANAVSVVNTTLGMFLFWQQEPHRFRSDDAFRFQLVRRVRALASMSAGTYWNHKAKRMTKVYRDLPPRTVRLLGVQLADAFGAAGLQLADIEARTVPPEELRKQRLAEAIEALA